VILQAENPEHHRLAVPDRPVLRVGTLHGILRAVSVAKAVGREEVLRPIR